MNVLLVNPEDSFLEMKGDRPPLGLAYLSAYLKSKGHHTKIWDLNHNKFSTLLALIDEYPPDFICLTVPTPNYNEVISLANQMRRVSPKSKFVAGGNHVASYPNEKLTMETFDFIVAGQGEGEVSLLDIVEGRATEKIVKSEYVENLDVFPLPDYDGLDMEKYKMLVDGRKAITMSASRGCIYSCVYCGSSTIKKVRAHSPEYVVNHMKMLYDKYDIRGYYFVDDIFSFNFPRTHKICNLIKQTFPKKDITLRVTTRSNLLTQELCNSLKEAGVDIICIGLESGSDKVLKAMRKLETMEIQRRGVEYCYNARIKVKGFFIIGLPEETWDDVMLTINFAKELVQTGRVQYADCYILNPIPASVFWQQPDQFDVKPIYPKDSNWSEYYQVGKGGHYKINIKHPHLTNEQLIEGLELFKKETNVTGLTY